MAYERKPIFTFESLNSTGINNVPNDKIIYCEENTTLYSKDNNSGLDDNSTLQDAIDNINVIKAVTASLDDLSDIEIVAPNGLFGGETIVWDEVLGKWVNSGYAGGPPTDDPIITAPTQADEGDEVDITIDNYSQTADYIIFVSSGTFTRTDNIITWTVPEVVQDTDHTLSIRAREPGHGVSGEVEAVITIIDLVPSNPPSISGPAQGEEDLPVTFIIDDWNANNDYRIEVSGGTTSRTDDNIQWTLPSVTENEDHSISVRVKEPGMGWSQPATLNLVVVNVNRTDKPVLSGPTSGNEYTDINITIDNYSSTATYTITPDGGTYVRTDATITWTLPGVSTSSNRVISVVANEGDPLLEPSLPTEYQVEVFNVGVFPDSTILYENASLDEFRFYNTENSLNSIITNNSLGDIVDTTETNTVSKIYLNNSKFEAAIGDNFITEEGEEFTAASVGYEGDRILKNGYKMISSSGSHSAIIKTDGYLWVSGNNDFGQLGLGDTVSRRVWTETGIRAKAVACGEGFTLIIKEDYSVWATGLNDVGQLGLGDTSNRLSFESTGIGNQAIEIAANFKSSYVIKSSGNVWSTGLNDKGQLGLGDEIDVNVFTDTGVQATKIVAGLKFALVLDGNNVLSTGANDKYQLGLGDNTDRNLFTNIPGVIADEIACGDFHSVYKYNGIVKSVGLNIDGQLGTGDNQDRTDWTQIATNVTFISAGGSNTSIIQNGDYLITGLNTYGQIGIGDNLNKNLFINTGLNNIIFAVVGNSSFAVSDDTTLYTAGDNIEGQLGKGVDDFINSFFESAYGISIPAYFSKYFVTPEVDLGVAPAGYINFRGHKVISRNILQEDNESDWLGTQNISLTFTNTDVFDSDNTSTVDKIYLDNSKINAKVGDYFATESGEIIKVASIGFETSSLTNVVNDVGEFANSGLLDNVCMPADATNNSYWYLDKKGMPGGTVFDNYPNPPVKFKKLFAAVSGQNIKAAFGQDYNNNVWAIGDKYYLGINDSTGYQYDWLQISMPETGEIKWISTGSNGGNTFVVYTNGNLYGTGENLNYSLGINRSGSQYNWEQINVGYVSHVNQSSSECSFDLFAESTAIISGTANLCGQDGSSNSPCCHGDCNYVDTFDVFGVDWNYPKDEFTDLGASLNSSATRLVYPYGHFSAILDYQGNVYTVGNNCDGQLGLGNTDGYKDYTQVSGLSNIQEIKVIGNGLIVRDSNDELKFSSANTPSNYFESTGITLPTSEMNSANDWIGVGAFQMAFAKADGTLWVYDFENQPPVLEQVIKSTNYYNEYWIVPENTLNNVPTEVYKIPEVEINDVKLVPNTFDLNYKIVLFDDIAYSDTRIIKSKINLNSGCRITRLRFTPIKY